MISFQELESHDICRPELQCWVYSLCSIQKTPNFFSQEMNLVLTSICSSGYIGRKPKRNQHSWLPNYAYQLHGVGNPPLHCALARQLKKKNHEHPMRIYQSSVSAINRVEQEISCLPGTMTGALKEEKNIHSKFPLLAAVETPFKSQRGKIKLGATFAGAGICYVLSNLIPSICSKREKYPAKT